MSEQLRAAGWFLLRTPLLPVETLERWADGAAEDRPQLRERLRALIAQPEIAEALHTASPSLSASLGALGAWQRAPESEAGQKLERALVRYLARMASRATPFQLLAGVTVGTIGDRTAIELAPRAQYRRRTHVEAARVYELADELADELAATAHARYVRSDAAFVLHDELRWMRRGDHKGMRSWTPSRMRRTPAIDAVFERAREPATLDELGAVGGGDVVAMLIEHGVLVHDLSPPVTGGDPLAWLVDHVRGTPAAASIEPIATAAAALDDVVLGGPPPAAALAGVPLQIDLVKPATTAVLRGHVATEMLLAVDALARLAPRPDDPLAKLREAYARRYDDLETPRFVPLLELVDPDGGVGLDGPQGPHVGYIGELGIPRPGPGSSPWTARETFLLRKLTATLAAGERELRLSRDEIAEVGAAWTPPDSLSVIASIAGPADDPRILVHHARTAATRLLGRFAYLPDVRPHIDQIVRAEAALHPDAVLAEVVHHAAGPTDLVGALHQRPVLRDIEIPLLACSGAPREHTLPLDDLLVSVTHRDVVLWSRRLDKRVLPRLASAHRVEFRKGHVPAFRLLYAIEHGRAPQYFEWTWGPIAAPFLPRVTSGRAVLALAEWRLDAGEVAQLDAATPERRLAAVRALRERRGLPRVVHHVDVERPSYDNVLFVDLDNSLAVDAFVHAAAVAKRAVLREPFAASHELPIHDADGHYAHELVVPFVRTTPSASTTIRPNPPSRRHAFPPGSEWLSLRIEAGMGRFDAILVEHLEPAIRRMLAAGDADGWFFLRLGLPVPQLRVRVHGDPQRLAKPRAELEAIIAELVHTSSVFRAEWNTYEREVERYGGDEAVRVAERIFEADSDCVVAILRTLVDRDDELLRERITLLGVDRLLADLGLDPAGKLDVMEALCTRWRRELVVDTSLEADFGTTFRRDRGLLERILEGAELVQHTNLYGLRSVKVRRQIADLLAHAPKGSVGDLAQNFVHMHAIRMSQRHSRLHELVIYDLLRRLYRSKIARDRAGT